MTDSSATRWTLRPTAHLHVREWDGETVIYHRESGDTHALNPVAAKALQILSRSPVTVDELVIAAADELTIEQPGALHVEFERLLGQFNELGLIEPVNDRQGTVQPGTG